MNKKELYILSVTIFLTIVAWIIADIYHISTTKNIQIGNTPEKKPISASIDENIIKILEAKE